MNIFKKLYVRALSKYNAGIDKRLLKKLLSDVSEADKPYFGALMKNELSYLNNLFVHQYTQQKEREQKEFYLQMTKRAIEKLMVLKNIVGIQPMQGPVGLVYMLRYATSADNQMRLEVDKATVEAGTRKLCAGWTIEAAQDLRSVHGIDIIAELQNALGREVADELVAEIIANLQNLGNKSPDNQQTPVTSRDHVVIAINKAASSIAMKTRRGAGNFVITSPMGVSLLQSNKYTTFVAPASDAQKMELTSLVHAGNIMANDSIMYPVYMSLAVKEESPSQITFIVGYKGRSGEIDTGYVYSPYVPVMPGGHVIDPQTFQPMMTLMTRYGKTMAKATDESPVEASAYYRTVVYDAALETIE